MVSSFYMLVENDKQPIGNTFEPIKGTELSTEGLYGQNWSRIDNNYTKSLYTVVGRCFKI
jgi:hypothetical protein